MMLLGRSLTAVALLGSVLACSSPPPADASQASEQSAPAGDEDVPVESTETVEAESPRPSCDDGTCFECGSGLCPIGAYCDLSAPGGAACAWIQECPGSPSCACLRKVLGSSCGCEESAGGPAVSCP